MFTNKLLLRFFPFLAWLPINSHVIRGDLIAGITGGLVLVPKAMAYAQLSGLPVYYGLYVALVPAVLVSRTTSLVDVTVFQSLSYARTTTGNGTPITCAAVNACRPWS